MSQAISIHKTKLFDFNWNTCHFIMKKENAKMKNKKLDAMKSIASPKYLLSIHGSDFFLHIYAYFPVHQLLCFYFLKSQIKNPLIFLFSLALLVTSSTAL
ncbi:hypothetical protein T12_271 [Trichinella patagoniensis]|uniref:Uncharacterized protein n=1 Tax=Trichinella patagoniensis TaxID=990121 RepID=A0A0V1AHY9_9BILA|nr:hypothetical protein T12_271 [Trichinella patagoniensis]